MSFRYTSSEEGKGGFTSLKYKDAEVVYDSSDSGMPSNHMYFLTTEYIGMTTHKDANMSTLEDKMSLNQDAVVIPIINQCNLTTANRARHWG
ncbi:phage major capsid protein [Thalassospira sp.]|uniref:phage major capsid protein n=1 Tax=Thalassospira sp. TaxID=1912094 RepID=UPI001B1C4893|nr:phage major capsid protein [Thalassospira sp.]MBO6808451.1 phage major capsid protein [Thalassospira sp.]MBO6839851.1 phage major capsid protein [Thalassospira sp.]